MKDPSNDLIEAMNNDLLASTGPQEAKDPEPKRNSKDDIILKIIKTAEAHNITLDLVEAHDENPAEQAPGGHR